MKGIKIGNKESKYPIIQGGMGVGVSLHNLAGNVSKEGGIGIISTADIGFKEKDFSNNPKKANLRAIKKEIDKAREIAGEDKILGVNIMVAMNSYKEIVTECVKNKIDLIISGAGIPKDLPEYVKGSSTKIAPIVSSLRCCILIVKHWIKKYNYIPDMIIIEGPEAGGHLGFKKEEILENKNQTLEEIVSEVVKYIRKKVKDPVFFFFCDMDSIEWCKKNSRIYGIDFNKDKVYFVDWNKGQNSFWDMYLMSQCSANIIANSTFSFWGAYLNKNNPFVIYPQKWVRTNLKRPNIFPKKWMAL